MRYRLMTLCMILGLTSYVHAGVFNEKNILINAIERQYVIKLPDGFDKKRKVPLIIALHGDGDSWKK